MKKQQGGKRNFPAGRLLAALLSLCLLIGLVPGAQTTAFADGTDKAIVPGVAGLNDPVFSNGYYYPSDYICFGRGQSLRQADRRRVFADGWAAGNDAL